MACIGIDLGTTNSCVAVHNDDRTVEIIKYKNGSRTIPSSVTFTGAETLVGFESVSSSKTYLTNTVYEAKRMIGQTYDNIKLHLEPNMYPFKVLEQGGYPKIQIKRNNQDVLIGPEDVSAELLKKLKSIAEENLKQAVRMAVITVPAYFVSSQREATKAAARTAGFESVNIISEPTAAALVYHRNLPDKKEAKVLVYDFGGGTFDVSVVSIKNKNCKVLGIDGDMHLGGADIDMNLVRFLKEDVKSKHQRELSGPMALKRLQRLAKDIKENLSIVDEYEVTMSDLCEDYTLTMRRAFFEKLNENLFHRTMVIVERCLKVIGLDADDIDNIVLVGGSSRIPKVQAMLQSFFKRGKLNHTINPDEAVAHGAAIYASFIANNLMETTFQDVVSLSLGIKTIGDVMSPVIERNREIPCMGEREYATTADNQSEVSIYVYQGERLIASKNIFLGNFTIKNLTRAPKGATKIRVMFSLNREGILTVTAAEKGKGNEHRLEIDMDKHIVHTQDINEQLTKSAQDRDEELKYTELVQRKIRFKDFVDQLKASLSDTNHVSRDFVIKKLDEVARHATDVNKINRMETLLRVQGNDIDALKIFFEYTRKCI